MSHLIFTYAPMGGGKTLAALVTNFQASEHGRAGLLLVMSPREASAVVRSRVGVSAPATLIEESTDLYELVRTALAAGPVHHVVADEAQFYTPEQVEQLADVVDRLGVPVHAFGLLTDFRTRLFPGSTRLLELADVSQPLPMVLACRCGAPATHNARFIAGVMQMEGSQKVVGDTAGGAEVTYESCCRACLRAGAFRPARPAPALPVALAS